MEKLKEITLGKKRKIIKGGNLFVLIFTAIIFYMGYFVIEIPVYYPIKFFKDKNKVLAVTDLNLKSAEIVKLDNNTIELEFINISKNRFEVSDYNKLPAEYLKEIKSNFIVEGEVLIDKEYLFKSLIPF